MLLAYVIYYSKIIAIVFSLIVVIESNATTINTFDSHYFDLLRIAESDPHTALDRINKIDIHGLNPFQKAQHLYFKSIFYSHLDYPNKALSHVQNALKLIDKEQQPWLYHHLSLERVNAWNRMGQVLKGFEDAENALSWSIQNEFLQLQLNSLYTLSSLYIQIEDYYKALSLVQEGYELAPSTGLMFVKADFSSQLAAIYIYREEFEIALPFLEETYQHEKEKNNLLGMAIGLYELGRAHLVLGNDKTGIEFLQESIQLSEQINDHQGLAYANNELANYYIDQKQFSVAEKLLHESLQKFTDANNLFMLFDTYSQLTSLYTSTAQLDKAEAFIELARPLTKSEELPYGEIAVQRMEAKILAAKGNHSKAFEILEQTIHKQQSLESKQSTDKLHAIRAMYEIESQNRQNDLLLDQNLMQEQALAKEKQQKMWLLVLLILASIIITLFIFLLFKIKKQTQKLHYIANYDELTGLRNRNNTIRSIRSLIEQPLKGEQLFLIMVDLDHFKSINDEYGHALGDKVLSVFGEYCHEVFNEEDIVGRVGGEEFMICLIAKNKKAVQQLIEELRIKTSNMPNHVKAPGLKVSISAGICMADNEKNRFRVLHKCADQAMYQAKNAGRNQVVFSQQQNL
jgi:diguanylate cyclase (GGDEF)-like protein